MTARLIQCCLILSGPEAVDDPQQMQRIAMVRLRGENLPIERLGLRQPTGLMVLQRED